MNRQSVLEKNNAPIVTRTIFIIPLILQLRYISRFLLFHPDPAKSYTEFPYDPSHQPTKDQGCTVQRVAIFVSRPLQLNRQYFHNWPICIPIQKPNSLSSTYLTIA